MQVGNFIDVFLARRIGRVYGADGAVRRTAPSAPYTRLTQRLSRPPPIQKLGAENHVLQLTHLNAPDDGRMYPKHVELRIHQ